MKLSEFLKENNVYEKFINYALKDPGTIKNIKYHTLGEIDINVVFYWEETTEGRDFWDELSSEFENLKDKIYDMDEVLYEEYNKRENTIEEETEEYGKHKDKILTLSGKKYKLVPIEEEEHLDEISIKEKYKSGNYIAIRLKDNKWELCDQDYKENFRGSSNIKLIKKEHSYLLNAYLKDKDIKLEYRWYDEPWMELEGDFIKNYDENMQLRLAVPEFEPFTLEIQVKTFNDLKSLWNRFNLDDSCISGILNDMGNYYYDVESNIDYEIWEVLDAKLRGLDGSGGLGGLTF